MASVTAQAASLGNDAARFFVTYDDVTMRVISVTIENDWTGAIKLTATDTSGTTITQTAQPGQHFTYTLKNNERYFYDQWIISMGAA